MMGWRIKSCESLWVLALLYYPGSGTGWWWDQIPHCRWGRCTGSCHRSSHTGPPCTAPSSSRTRSHLRKTGEEGVRSAEDQARTRRHALHKAGARSHAIIFIISNSYPTDLKKSLITSLQTQYFSALINSQLIQRFLAYCKSVPWVTQTVEENKSAHLSTNAENCSNLLGKG